MYNNLHDLGFLVEKWRQTRERSLGHYARSYFSIHTPLRQMPRENASKLLNKRTLWQWKCERQFFFTEVLCSLTKRSNVDQRTLNSLEGQL